MISKERVRYMTKLAAFEEREGRRCRKMTQYFRSDYVGLEILKSFLSGTAAFGIMLAMWMMCRAEDLMKELNSMDFAVFGTEILIKYLIFISLYLLVTYVVYNVRYTRGRKRIKVYYNYLKKVNRLHETESRQTGVDKFDQM